MSGEPGRKEWHRWEPAGVPPGLAGAARARIAVPVEEPTLVQPIEARDEVQAFSSDLSEFRAAPHVLQGVFAVLV